MTPVLDHIDILDAPRTLGPSPWLRCSRPSCRLAYRALRFADPVPCPMCGTAHVRSTRGLTRAQRDAMEVA